MRVKRVVRLGRAMAAMLACGLAACTTQLPPAPSAPARFQAAWRLVPPDRHFVMADGAVLPARVWAAPGRPRALLLALHGFYDSRDAWEYPGPVLAAQGITVVAPDQRGFGAAPGRGHWAGSQRMTADVREEVAVLARENPGVPLYLAGESMGGAVLMVLMAQPDAPRVAGTILLAPAVWRLGLGATVPLDILAGLSPDSVVTGRELPVHVVASNNIAALVRLYYDPLSLRGTRLGTLRGLVQLMDEAARAAPRLHGPVLCVYGGHDQLVPPAAMGQVWRSLGPAGRRDLVPGGYHLLLRDKGRALVERDLVAWITQPDWFLPSGGDSAASAWLAQGRGEAWPGHWQFPWFLPARLDTLVGADNR